MMQDTSTQAYDSIRDSLNEKQRIIRSVLLRVGPMSNAQLATVLRWPINTVTPRIHELRKLDVIEDAGTVVSRTTGRKVHVWKLKYPTPTTTSPKVEATSKQATLA
jgi:predicted ArsR family transcriptional regulator